MEHFLHQAAASGSAIEMDDAALELLLRHPWRGNVRELKTLIQRLALLAGGRGIAAADVAAHLTAPRAATRDVDELEAVLRAHGWSVTRTARALGVGRTTVYRYLKLHELRRPRTNGHQNGRKPPRIRV